MSMGTSTTLCQRLQPAKLNGSSQKGLAAQPHYNQGQKIICTWSLELVLSLDLGLIEDRNDTSPEELSAETSYESEVVATVVTISIRYSDVLRVRLSLSR